VLGVSVIGIFFWGIALPHRIWIVVLWQIIYRFIRRARCSF
jgi:hypothetical protein